MKAWLLTLLLSSAVHAEVKNLTFYCEPGDAHVFVEVGGTAPYLLGQSNRPLPVDMAVFDGRSNPAITFRREGWKDETRVLPQSNGATRYFANRDCYPDASQGPVRLTPGSDPSSRFRQATYFLGLYWPGLAVSGLAAAVLGTRWKRRLQVLEKGNTRARELDSMRVARSGPDPLLMKVLGGYRLVESIGVGGMGSVYRAVPDTSLDEKESVAVKVMHPQFATDLASRKRFRREIEIYRDLSHRNILRLDDYGEEDGLLYLVVELLKGKTLRHVLSGPGPSMEIHQGEATQVAPGRVAPQNARPARRLSLEEVLQYVRPLAETMDYAHSKRIVHRDLKPENVFLTEEGRLVVMDFGIARGGDYTQATATGDTLGTPSYMAPEQLQGRPEAASDLYSFGIMLYEMFAGDVPFQGEDPMAVAFLHVGQQPPSLGRLRPDLPKKVVDAVARLLSKDPKKRFASFGEALAAMQ